MKINEIVKEIHENAIVHGWWEDKRSFGDIIALCHTELTEAFEEYRNGRKPTEVYFSSNNRVFLNSKQNHVCYKPEGIPTELADCIIRIFDYCGQEGIDIEEAIRIKHEYNKIRSYKHGNKIL